MTEKKIDPTIYSALAAYAGYDNEIFKPYQFIKSYTQTIDAIKIKYLLKKIKLLSFCRIYSITFNGVEYFSDNISQFDVTMDDIMSFNLSLDLDAGGGDFYFNDYIIFTQWTHNSFGVYNPINLGIEQIPYSTKHRFFIEGYEYRIQEYKTNKQKLIDVISLIESELLTNRNK